jgi:hypothetical protein
LFRDRQRAALESCPYAPHVLEGKPGRLVEAASRKSFGFGGPMLEVRSLNRLTTDCGRTHRFFRTSVQERLRFKCPIFSSPSQMNGNCQV